MKKQLLSISLILLAATSFGQAFWGLTFDDTTYINRVIIDTVANPNNIWQIGHPDKTIFNSAHSSPNVIATDTLNSYPINDTSSFTIIHIANLGWYYNYYGIFIDGWYYVNSDTLTDYAFIEFSPDHGNTWFNIDSTQNNGCCWDGSPQELPTFSGNSFGWKHFHYCLCTSTHLAIGDTVLYRFKFISDSVQTNKDGIMFDDLQFEDMISGIEEFQNNNPIAVYPNPAQDKITIESKSATPQSYVASIKNIQGQEMLREKINYTTTQTIDVSGLSNGIYILSLQNEKENYIKKIVVQH